jgi:mono/diheme cytochrome c family protein
VIEAKKPERRLLAQGWRRFEVWIAALVFSSALVALPFLFRLDGKTHADWQQFLGRFHPLAVHLPIGLLVLLPVLEIAGSRRASLREAAHFVLGLSFVCCVGSLALGYLLAFGAGTTGTVVTRHMWGGIALTILVMLCLLARPSWFSGRAPWLYPSLLCGVLGALIWTADHGGSLTHGSNYLTQFMPAPLKALLPSAVDVDSAKAQASFYAQHINPIFDANCVACHGESKSSGGLRLDSYTALMKGGQDGPVVVAGQPDKSELLVRVTLPSDHKEFMPAQGRPPLQPEEIGWIRAWIQQGASPTVAKLDGIVIRGETPEAPLQPVGDYSALMDEIRRMQKGQGAKLVQVSSKPSDGLILNTIDVAATFSDADLAQFGKFAPYIVEAELGRTAVTDASFSTLASFTHLRALHLEGTAITGDGLQKLSSLSQLTYLNLSNTRVTKAAADRLELLRALRHVYLYNTPAQPVAAQAAAAAQPAEPIARNAP